MSALDELTDPAFPPANSWHVRWHSTRLPARYLGSRSFGCSRCKARVDQVVVYPGRPRPWGSGRGHPLQLCQRCIAKELPPLQKIEWTDEERMSRMAKDNAALPHAIVCIQSRREGRGEFAYVHSRYPTGARAEAALDDLREIPALPRTSRRFELATPELLASATDFEDVSQRARAK